MRCSVLQDVVVWFFRNFKADVSGTEAECLASPRPKDLERLLELITPSRIKFDADEDEIMVGTLLRQRRKGPCSDLVSSTGYPAE